MANEWQRTTIWLGLIPYELYVLPGMFIAIITMLWYETFDPIQLHLLPHWFAYSMSQYIKNHVYRRRPGCQIQGAQASTRSCFRRKSSTSTTKTTRRFFGSRSSNPTPPPTKDTIEDTIRAYLDRELESLKNPGKGTTYEKIPGSNIAQNHCEGKTATQSFPSGHTMVAFSLATSLSLYLIDPRIENKDKTFLGIPFYNQVIRSITIFFALFVAVMISEHRVANDYHYRTDVIVGAILGMGIGFTSYHICNKVRGACKTFISKQPPLGSAERVIYQIVRWTGILLSLIGLVMSFRDMRKPENLKH